MEEHCIVYDRYGSSGYCTKCGADETCDPTPCPGDSRLAEAKRQGAMEVLDTMRDYCNQVINIDRDDPDSWYLKAFKSVSAKLDDIRARYETTGDENRCQHCGEKIATGNECGPCAELKDLLRWCRDRLRELDGYHGDGSSAWDDIVETSPEKMRIEEILDQQPKETKA